MKNFKNTFIIWIICIIIWIIFSQVLKAYSSSNIDTNTYMSLIKWKATVNDTFITSGIPEVLVAWDTVRTIWKTSLAVIEWWDGSITRLGWNTKIIVWNNEVSRDFTKIDISFELLAGKTWSQVVSFISSDSSFTQKFQWLEAWVRGTVFDVNLEDMFIYVTDHAVNLQDIQGNNIIISENSPFSLEQFSFIELDKFISQIRDIEWQQWNLDLDQTTLKSIKDEIDIQLTKNNPFSFFLEVFSPTERFFQSLYNREDYGVLETQISLLNASQKQKIETRLLSEYQKLNLVSIEDRDNYQRKLLYKKLLLLLSEKEDKERLLESTLYDFKDSISSQDIPSFEKTLGLLSENSELLKNMDVERFFQDINLIPDDLENIMRQNFQEIQNFFEAGEIEFQEVDFSWVTEVVNNGVESLKQDVWDVEEKARQQIEKGLDKIFDSVVN